nr:hypothetical protein AOSUZXEW_AOSUZXEW_CDS_0005 [Microvirus sp.]
MLETSSSQRWQGPATLLPDRGQDESRKSTRKDLPRRY